MNKKKIVLAKPEMNGNELKYVTEAMRSNWISGGRFVEKFEKDFGCKFRIKNTLSVSNGTTALNLALLSLQLKPGDEVIIPGFGFMAAANVSILMNLRPVFAEVDLDTWCINSRSIEEKITKKTKAIVVIHTYGNVCDMDAIIEIANRYQLPLIEDAAEAIGSRYKSKYAGTMSSIGTFSFHATKTIATGEGGMVVSNNQKLMDIMKLYRSHGMLRVRHYWHEIPGHNFRMPNLQAAIGCAQLENLEIKIAEYRRVYARYQSKLANVDGIHFQKIKNDVDPVVWMTAVRVDSKIIKIKRDDVILKLKDQGIETRPGFYTPDSMSHAYGQTSNNKNCTVLAEEILVLPTHTALKNKDIDFVCNTLKKTIL
jgi:perosamine synthetase